MASSYLKRVTLPTIALLSREEGDSIVLQCQIKDYYPDKLSVKWFKGDQPVNADDTKLQTTNTVNNNFTYISQISIGAQNEDKPYTCKATHNSRELKEEYNLCMAKSVSKPSIQVKKANVRDILEESEVTFSCIVEAPHSTVVSWSANTAKKNTEAPKYLHNKIVSNWTLPKDEWLKLETIVCTAKHPCFPEEKVTIQVDDVKKDPVVVIRRTFKKSDQSGSALLECVVKDLPSGEVCINFQVNHSEISEVKCVDWTNSENILFLTTHFTIPIEHQKKGNTFTCRVHRLLKSWASEPIGNMFDDPTIELLVVPSVGEFGSQSQKLLCSGKGFDPKIKWISKSNDTNGTDVGIVTMMEDGRVKVYSEILVPQQEWEQDVNYTCEIDNGRSGKKAATTSFCSAKSVSKPSIQVKKANVRDILEESEVTFSCIVEAPHSTVVSWSANTAIKNTEAPEYLHNKIVSNWTLPKDEWLKLETIVCTAKHPCFPEEKVTIQVDDVKKDPVVVIRRTFKKSDQSGSALLECVVKDLPSGEVCINFQVNHSEISEVKCVDWTNSKTIWFLTTHFTIPIEHQKKGNTFTCRVHRLLKSWASEPIGNIFDDPTIELLVVPSVGEFGSESQKLLCSGKGFDPKIKWISKSKDKTGTDVGIVTMMEDGRVKVYSEILVPQQEWEQDVNYTCEIDNGRSGKKAATTSFCSAKSVSKPSIQVKKANVRDILEESEVTFSCIVEAPHSTVVSWSANTAIKNTEAPKYLHNKIVSNWTLPKDEWLKLETIVCTAKHPCFPEEKVTIQVDDVKKDPVVVIRRTFKKSDQSGSALLECVVKDLPSGEVCINFQVNHSEISEVKCVDWTNSENILFLTTHFTIPIEHQKKGNTFTCRVHRLLKSWASEPIGKIFDDPTIELLVVPSVGEFGSESQKLLCSGKGFDPKIKWISKSKDKTGTDVGIVTMMEDGRVKVYSEILVPQQEWEQNVIYTCEIDNGRSGKKAATTSFCSAKSVSKPSIQVKKANVRDILEEREVTFSCIVEAPHSTVVSWSANTAIKNTEAPEYLHNKIVSNWTLPKDEWLKLETIVCTAKHPCFSEEKVTIQVDDVKKDPVVVIRRTFKKSDQSGSALLECVVKDLPSGEVCINFQVNHSEISEVKCVDWTNSKKIWFLTTHFTIPIEHQKKGNTFTCRVHRLLKSWASEPIGNIFDDPTIELLVVPSVGEFGSESQKLLCSGKGFDPKIKWISKSKDKTGTDVGIVTMMEDGRVKVYSEILVPQQEWEQNVIYTCEIDNGRSGKKAATTSFCSAKSVSKPSIQVKKANVRDILEEREVTFSCIVEAPHSTVVSWSANTAIKNTEAPKYLHNKIVSNWTLPKDEWLKLETIVCTAKHPCFSEEKVTIQVDDVKKDPVVVIRRTFKKSDQSGSALLECVVKDLPSGEVCINFQVNHSEISEVKCVDWTNSENILFLTTHFTIPIEHQKKGNTFTCRVHRLLKSWASEPIGNIFDDPTIELLVVPSVGEFGSESQKLLCSGKGFDPKIKWISKSKDKTGTDVGIVTMMEDGLVKVYSEILVPQQEWEQDVNYTCEIDNGRSGKKAATTSFCSVMAPSSQQADVYLLGPSQNNLTCLVVGQSAKFFSIQWKKNGVNENLNVFEQPPIDYANGTQSKSSMLKVSNQTWNKYEVFTCEVKHLCSLATQQQSISKTKDPKKPTVRIFRPSDSDLSGLQNTSLLCFITGFFPSKISVEWQLNGMQLDVSRFIDSPVVAHTSGSFSMHSALILPAAQWKDDTYSCIVFHESSQSPFNATLRNLYASLIHSAPAAKLVQGANELVCLAYGFSPPAINITWLLGMTEVYAYNETNPAKGSDGKFSIRSHLQLPSDWAPGEVYTCRVTHVTGTQLLNISKKSAIFEEAIFMNEIRAESIAQDTVEEAWNMACAFLALFVLSLLYGCIVTLVKVKPE